MNNSSANLPHGLVPHGQAMGYNQNNPEDLAKIMNQYQQRVATPAGNNFNGAHMGGGGAAYLSEAASGIGL